MKYVTVTHMSFLSSLFLKGWKGSRPVAAWKNVAPTLHKSTCSQNNQQDSTLVMELHSFVMELHYYFTNND